MARPRIAIDWAEFDKLCFIQCSEREIAQWFECSVDTIDRACHREKKMGFADYSLEKRGRGRISLRRQQFEVAMKGNVGMLIWLGKNYLDQTDKMETSNKELAKLSNNELADRARKLIDKIEKGSK